ncbi:hypothetical protein BUALT_Bualt06G0108600 [Buddleja alternifolia]|uniref:mitogen-activated protein kinase kinase kinase n=1 Tax=Buddleja alternifolia TaxID=168488 RepID=A0AAV6XIK0_9LAMI|nr:hypothetical protein BUALT_Bualt06G0108600 [Buddleja alternifolia]
MSRNYDNWERLVAAVLKKQQLWQLFHEQSRSPSISSESSGFSFSFHLSSSLDDFPTAEFSASYQKEYDFDSESATDSRSNIVVEDQSPVKNVSSTRSRRRDLKIEVQNLRVPPRTNWPNDSKQQSYPLPLPPVTNSATSPFSRPNSAATSPSAPSRSPESAENVTSPGSHWKKGKFLGRGAFANVYIGFNSEIGGMCAMKEITLLANDGESKRSVRQLGKQLEIEIMLLSSLRHPNIVQYYGSEMVSRESAIRSYTQQILSGLAYLHSKSVAHRDFKGSSILVDPSGRVKLGNFGIAKHIPDQSGPSLLPSSPYWMAPEVLSNPNVRNQAVDMWSLGCTVLEMATSRPPLSQHERMVAMFKARNHKELPIIPDHLSDEGKDFVRCCLQWNPVHRATASQLLEHPFVKNVPPLEKQTLATNAKDTQARVGFSCCRLCSFCYAVVKGIDHARSFHELDSGRLPNHSSMASIYNFHPSDMYTPRNITSPVTAVGSPLRHPRSPQHLNEMISPPPISSPHTTSSSSTSQIPIFSQGHSSPSYWDPNILRGAKSKSHAFQELPSSENDSRGKQLGSTANEQLVLADRVSKKLLNTPLKMNPSLDLNSSSRLPILSLKSATLLYRREEIANVDNKNYDNWERLVSAVLKKQQLWQLFHEQSRSPSISSESSGFNFHLSSSLDDFPSAEFSASYRNEHEFGSESASDSPSNIVVEDQSPVENVSFTRRKRRDLKIEVPNNNITATSPSTPSPSRSPERAENFTIPGSHWKKGKFLGRGEFGNVYSGFNSETGDMCAMKEVTLFANNGESKRSVRQLGKQLGIEIRLLSSLRHPNIVQYYGSEMLGDNFYICLEYISGGSIDDILQQYGRLEISTIRSYTQQILSGLAYLHSKSIAHGHVKGANILLDPNGSVKLANIGIAKHVIMNSNVRNRAFDIWSLGWTLLDMATSKPPLSHYEWMVAMLKAGNHRELPIIPDHLSDEGKDFVRRCFHWNPVHRATASQLLEHPFVKNLPPLQKPPPLEKQTIATNAGIDHARSFHQLDSGRLPIHSSVASIYNFHPSDMYTPRNISPVGSPLRHPRSPQHLNEMISPPPISSPHTTSGSSTCQIPIFSQGHSSPPYWDPNILRGAKSKYHAFKELPSRENDSRGKQLGSTSNGQLVLADRVSKKLLNTPSKMNPSLDPNSSSRLPSHPVARV